MGKKYKEYDGGQNIDRNLYDSDDDLTKEEKERIAKSSTPKKTRQQIWDNKDMFPKIKKYAKSAWYGDKRDK